MCGFVGFISKDVNDPGVLRAMTEMISHRGPDSDGFFEEGSVHFGFRRLSIIDLESGSQPIIASTGNAVIVFNGEIYNYQDIKKDLLKTGYEFKTDTDSEVIIAGYERYGIDELLSKLRGMFAFTIYDKKKDIIVGARDHFGIKPYYYSKQGDDFLFGSEIKAFLRYPKFKKEINTRALKHYLVFQYNPLDESFFKGVNKLRPGHYYTYEDGKMDIKKYFDLVLDYQDMSLDDSIERIDKAVSESVKYHQISDVEVGAFLSGGVDSSFVVSKSRPEKTFSVGFENDGFDETVYSKDLSKRLGIKNFSKMISPDEFFEGIDKVQYYSDEPHANLSSVALYFLARLAREHVKVVLSGEGADELFAGYNDYEVPFLHKLYKLLPFCLRHKLYDMSKDKQHFRGRTIIMKYGEKPELSYIGQANVMSDDEANDILKNRYKNDEKASDLTAKYYDKVRDMDDASKMLFLDMNMWIVDDILLKADKMTMANSLELRVPFLDKEMWDLARKIPIKHKMAKSTTKYAFRKAAERIIPKGWSRRRKAGFMVPFVSFIKEEKYYKIVKEMFAKPFAAEFFDSEKINELLDMHYKGLQNTGRKVYNIYTFLVWYEQYFVNEISQ